jgi:hypothetical protein
MDWIGIVVAGLVATAVITALMYAGPMMKMPRMDIAQMLGPMALPVGNTAFATGMMVHFMMGVVFAIIYALVWLGLGIDPNWWTGLVFGAVHFAVAGLGMSAMPLLHKEVRSEWLPSPMASEPMGLMGMLVGHLVFGLVVAMVYRPFMV